MSIPWRSGVKLESFSEAICSEFIFRAEQSEALPGTPTGFMSNKRILGGEVAYVIDIHRKTSHLMLHPVMMPILLLRPLGYCVGCCISVGMMRQAKLSSKGTSRSRRIGHMNTVNWLGEALKFSIVKMEWLLGRLMVDGFI